MSINITEDCPQRCPISTKYSCDTFGRCFESDTGPYNKLSDCHDAILRGYCGSPKPTNTPGPTSTPEPTSPPSNVGVNSANYNGQTQWGGYIGKITTVGTNGGPSYYGTYDQNGNVREIIQYNYTNTVTKGGGYADSIFTMASFYQTSTGGTITTPRNILNTITTYGNYDGFRLCICPASNPGLALPVNTSLFCLVGDEKNNNDFNNLGSVVLPYYIGKYTVTNCEYVEFLNSVARYDITNYASPLYVTSTAQAVSQNYGITRTGSPGDYSYSVKAGYENKPIIAVSYLNAVRYCNWLSLGKPSVLAVSALNGVLNGTTTPYFIGGSISVPTITNNFQEHLYTLPTESQWYKAAYYDPTKAYKYNTFATQVRGTYTPAQTVGGVANPASITNAPSTITANSNGDGPLPINYNCP
jgi:formylglycine-generating enzyme required for sulfatase activity